MEAGDGADTLVITEDSQGDYISYIDLGSQASNAFDTLDLRSLTLATRVDMQGGTLEWKSPGIIFGSYDYSIQIRNAEAALGGGGDDWLRSRNEAGTKFYLAGGAGDDTLIGLAGDDVLDGGADNDTIISLGGTNTIVDHEGKNVIFSRGDHDTVIIDGSQSLVELGTKTLIVGADQDDRLTRFGIQLHGGVQQWWNESGTAVWSPYNALLSAFPFIGAQALFSVAAMAADAPYMKFAKYRVDAETGDILIDLGWGLGGAARIVDYDLDLATGKGDAGITVFRQGRVKQGANSGIKASNGVEQYVNLALYSGWGHGLAGFDPLVLDLDDNGYDLILREYSQVYFEFDSDGFAENAGWIGGNDAFLVRDLNSNGIIDDITEMFGNRTTSGFAALGVLDSNADGIFNIADADFSAVKLWKDSNSNGITDAGELISLADAGIASISLTAMTLTDTDVRGNVVVREASFTRTDGTTGKVGDIALDVSDTDTRWTGTQTPSQAAEALPQIAGIGELVNLRVAMTGDATLLSMVNSFAGNSSASMSDLREDVADILYRWAGVDGVTPTAIGSGGFDTRKLAFLEKYVGIQLMPRSGGGAILTTNLAEVEALWNYQFNQIAFKLIAQGPLAAEFAGLTYYESHDLLRAANGDTVATILAGFLDDMPSDGTAAGDYWEDWGPLLGAFAGTVMRTSGVEVGRDYFFAELVKAVDSRSLPLDIETLAAGLAIDGLKIGGVSALTRTSGDTGTLVYYSETANQQFTGGTGQDAYIFGSGGNDLLAGGEGNDTLNGGSGTDTALLMGLSATYSMVSGGGSLSVTDNAPTVNGDDGTDSLTGMEKLRFSNGQEIGITSPIILDLDGGGVTTVSAQVGRARYDMDGDGISDMTSWMGRGEGMLFLDRDGNGTLSNAGEFSFVNDVEGAASDLVGLRAFDSNEDGILSSADDRFADFRIWRDRNGDAAVQDGEILLLGEAGVASLNLHGQAVSGKTAIGDVAILNTGIYTRTDGQAMGFIDAALTYFSGASQTSLSNIVRQQIRPASRRQMGVLDRDGLLGGVRQELQIDWQYARDTSSHLRQLWDQKMWSEPAIMAIDNRDSSAVSASPGNSPVSSIDRQLAMMVQDMSVFGLKTAGESLQPWQRENENVRSLDFFA